MNKPIKIIEKVKYQMKQEISNLHSDMKSEITTKLKRIVINETNLDSLKREFKNFKIKYQEKEAIMNSPIEMKKNNEKLTRVVTDIREIKVNIMNIEKKIDKDFKLLQEEFGGYKAHMISSYQSVYEKELEKYKKNILRMQIYKSQDLKNSDSEALSQERVQSVSPNIQDSRFDYLKMQLSKEINLLMCLDRSVPTTFLTRKSKSRQVFNPHVRSNK